MISKATARRKFTLEMKVRDNSLVCLLNLGTQEIIHPNSDSACDVQFPHGFKERLHPLHNHLGEASAVSAVLKWSSHLGVTYSGSATSGLFGISVANTLSLVSSNRH